MYNNGLIPTYNPQVTVDRINAQIAELEKMRNQMTQQTVQPTNLTQNFQLAPTNKDTIKYASSIEQVKRDTVIGDTPFFSSDLSVVWIKNLKGEIKTYELTEIIPKDEKDFQIELLQQQINELKGRIENESHTTNVIPTKNATDTSESDETIRVTTKKSKSTSL